MGKLRLGELLTHLKQTWETHFEPGPSPFSFQTKAQSLAQADEAHVTHSQALGHPHSQVPASPDPPGPPPQAAEFISPHFLSLRGLSQHGVNKPWVLIRAEVPLPLTGGGAPLTPRLLKLDLASPSHLGPDASGPKEPAGRGCGGAQGLRPTERPPQLPWWAFPLCSHVGRQDPFLRACQKPTGSFVHSWNAGF